MPAGILAKLIHVTDEVIVKKIYEAAVELGLKNDRGVFRSQEELYKHYRK